MNIVEVCVGEKTYPIKSSCPTNRDKQTIKKPKFPSTNNKENSSDYEKVSTSQTKAKNIPQSHNSNVTPRNSKVQNYVKRDSKTKDDFHDNISSAALNYSLLNKTQQKEDTLKVTKYPSSVPPCTTQATAPHIKDCPEIIRSNQEDEFTSNENELPASNIGSGSLQLQLDTNKLYKSEFISYYHNLISNESLINKTNVYRDLKTKSIQTLPVLILPLSSRDKMIGTDEIIINSVNHTIINNKSDSRLSNHATASKNMVVETLPKEPQMSQKSKNRVRTISEGNAFSKTKGNLDSGMEKTSELISTKNELWGDVYNDYKNTTVIRKEKNGNPTLLMQRKSSVPTVRLHYRNRRETFINGDSVSKRVGDIFQHKLQDYTKYKTSDQPNSANDSAGLCLNSKLFETEENLQGDHCFQRCFQAQPFDELVKSFMKPSDRRIRAVCSKMKCQIRMFGPTALIPYESKYQPQTDVHKKSTYHIVVSTNTKERLDKSIKCIQETFPKTCLVEKLIIQQNLECYGDEIPL